MFPHLSSQVQSSWSPSWGGWGRGGDIGHACSGSILSQVQTGGECGVISVSLSAQWVRCMLTEQSQNIPPVGQQRVNCQKFLWLSLAFSLKPIKRPHHKGTMELFKHRGQTQSPRGVGWLAQGHTAGERKTTQHQQRHLQICFGVCFLSPLCYYQVSFKPRGQNGWDLVFPTLLHRF